MPSISSVSLKSFKGQTRTHVLAPGVNLIVGPNGAGKTTIAQAIAFVLAKAVPGLPKTNGPLMDCLGSGLTASASVTIDGVTFDRSLHRTAKGATIKALNPAPDALVPPVMLDLGLFLAASPAKRAGMILGACGDDVPAKLHAMAADHLGAHITVTRPCEDLQAWLAGLDEQAKAKASDLLAETKAMRGTLAGLEALQADLAPWRGPTLAEARAEVARLDRELAELQGQIRAFASLRAPFAPAYERPNGTAADFEAQGRQAQAERDAAAQEWSTLKVEQSLHDSHAKKLRDTQAQCEAARQLIEQHKDTPRLSLEEIQGKLDECQNAEAEARANLANAKRMSLAGLSSCSCCGAKSEHWTVKAATAAELAALETALTEASAALATARNQADIQAQITAAESIMGFLAQAQADLDAHPAPEGLDEAQDRLDNAAEAVAELANAAKQAREWEAYDKDLAEHAQAQQQASALQSQADGMAPAIDAARAALATAEAQQASRAQAEAQRATAKQAEERLAEVEKAEAELKAARDAWKAGLAEVMDAALREVLGTCELLTKGLFPSPLTVHDLELGRYEGPNWIPLDAFCGSDQRIAHAAVATALAIRAPGLKLAIVDEAGVIDPARLPVFLANLADACGDGLLDQALVFANAMPKDTAAANVLEIGG